MRNSSFRTLVSSLILTCTLPALSIANTTVYKTVHPDGSITYSDQESANSDKIDVKPIATVPAFKGRIRSDEAKTESRSKSTAGYQSLTVVQPSNGSAFHSANGTVNITVESMPGLKPGHSYQAVLDGTPMTTSTSNAFSLLNVHRGTHSLVIHIIDANLNPLQSASTTFTIHRPIKR